MVQRRARLTLLLLARSAVVTVPGPLANTVVPFVNNVTVSSRSEAGEQWPKKKTAKTSIM